MLIMKWNHSNTFSGLQLLIQNLGLPYGKTDKLNVRSVVPMKLKEMVIMMMIMIMIMVMEGLS